MLGSLSMEAPLPHSVRTASLILGGRDFFVLGSMLSPPAFASPGRWRLPLPLAWVLTRAFLPELLARGSLRNTHPPVWVVGPESYQLRPDRLLCTWHYHKNMSFGLQFLPHCKKITTLSRRHFTMWTLLEKYLNTRGDWPSSGCICHKVKVVKEPLWVQL